MTEEVIFHEALAMVPADRGAYLDQACAGEPALRAAVEALLRADAGATGFLESPPAGPTVDAPSREGPGTVLGRYKLLEQIGEGGMGTVYRAQQTEPVKRLVALKLIKPGMDSRQVFARFEAERQALAVMDHPNIAKVLDGGLHEHRPFFVMELVKGIPITQYCDDRHLTPMQRLELFVPVCQAIQHAHQKGVIHRDIKPSNVLVALYDDRPVPKVIDFGVAKATGQPLTERTIDTGFGRVVGTPEYMSPEQATFNNLDIDTRSDVYALGVLLYELLAGSPPFSRKELEEKGLLEMLRVVREEEPPRPSTRLSTADALPTLSANRGTDAKKLAALLRGELDWIVMKALEKDRNRRYETANGLARDIQRYLADEPVTASPPSPAYRFRKFARRNRRVLASGAMVIVALLAGTIISAWQAIRATRAIDTQRKLLQQAKESEAAAKESERVAIANMKLASQHGSRADRYFLNAREVVDRMTERLQDPKLLQIPEVKALRKQLLEDLLACYQNVYQDDAGNPPGLQEKASALRMIGDIRMMLGEPELAEKAYRDAIAMRESYVAQHPTRLESYQILATCYARLGDLMSGKNQSAEAEAVYRRALVLWASLATDRTYLGPVYGESLRSYHQALFKLLDRQGQGEQARAVYGLLLAPFEESAAKSREQIDQRFRLADALCWGTFLLADTGRAKEADILRDRAIALYAQLPTTMPAGREGDKLLFRHLVRIRLLAERKRWAEVEDACRRIPKIEPNPTRAWNTAELMLATASDLDRRARLLRDKGRLDDAIAVWRKSIELDPRRGGAHFSLGVALRAKGDLDEAERAYREAVRLDGKQHGVAIDALAQLLLTRGNLKEAVGTYRTIVALDPKDAQAHYRLGNALKAKGELEEAVAAYLAAAEVHEKKNPADANSLYNAACYRALTAAARVQAGGADAVRLAKEEADRSMGWLAKAVAAGLADAIQISRDDDLNSLRDREDFRKLLADVVAKLPLVERAQYYIRLSQWDKAAAEYAKAGLLARPLRDDAFTYACLLLVRKDGEGYNRFCQGMIDRAAKTEDPFEAFVLARSCAMAPKGPIDPAQVVQWANLAAATDQRAWYLHALGLAQYRAGQFDQALQSYTKANVEAWTLRDLNWLGLALVHHHLGHPEEARRCLDKGIQWLEREGPAKLPPQDWLEAQLLRHEAEGMLNTKRGP